MANILLGVTGSVAAIHTCALFDALRDAGYHVKVVATQAACYFFDPAALAPLPTGARDPGVVVLDDDEWSGVRYQRGDPVLHVELRRWADLLLIAPLDANTLAKLALGLCDNCLTCIYRAWDPSRPVVLAPAMNTLMWEHPATARHLAQITDDIDSRRRSLESDRSGKDGMIASLGAKTWTVVAPIVKRLACQDVGVGALADRAELLAAVHDALNLDGAPRG